MKKLLTILGSLGVAATAAAGVVACGTQADDKFTPNADVAGGTVTFKQKNVTIKDNSKTSPEELAKDFTVKNGKDAVEATFSFEADKKDDGNKTRLDGETTVTPVTGTLTVTFAAPAKVDHKQNITYKLSTVENSGANELNADIKFTIDTLKDSIDTKTAALATADAGAKVDFAVTIPAGAVVLDGWDASDYNSVKLVDADKAELKANTDFKISVTDDKKVDDKTKIESNEVKLTVEFVKAPTSASYTLTIKDNSCLDDAELTITNANAKPVEKTNADISIKTAVADAAGTTITVTLDDKLVSAVTDADVTLDGATKDGTAAGIDKGSNTITVKVTPAMTKDSKVTVKIAGLKDAAKGIAVDVSAITPQA